LFIRRVGTRLNELNVPLKRNQSLIVQMVMTYRKQIVDVALIDELCDPELIKKRSELLRSPEVSELLLQLDSFSMTCNTLLVQESKLLKYHIALVELLASCAEGENRYIESMCQTIFGLDELMQVLGDTKIPHIRKTPYIRYASA
jgi:hypothetical protein